MTKEELINRAFALLPLSVREDIPVEKTIEIAEEILNDRTTNRLKIQTVFKKAIPLDEFDCLTADEIYEKLKALRVKDHLENTMFSFCYTDDNDAPAVTPFYQTEETEDERDIRLVKTCLNRFNMYLYYARKEKENRNS